MTPAAATPVAGAAERAIARVDVGAIERNAALLKARLGDADLCAVVKADGYGHGMLAAAEAALSGGATRIAVATAREAAELRAGGVGTRVLVMGALTPGELELALGVDADVVAWTEAFVKQAAGVAPAAGRAARLHVKADTGMGRLGTADPGAVLTLFEQITSDDRLEAAGLMTHFATADEEDKTFFEEQLARFSSLVREVKASYPGICVHAANSAAVLSDPAAHFDMARCGIALYGLDPFQADPHARGLEPALELESYVAAVKRFRKGESAGYGRTWAAPRDTWVGVLPIGYGDGYRRGLSNAADVLVRGRRRPLAGTVSMDNVTIDLGPETDVAVGEPAVLIGVQGGERILAEELAQTLGTINYEITCGLSARVPRLHASRASAAR